ncbi:glycoside hydrolase family 13 protein [Pedobacter puniceum]|uniref:Alpha-amylase n=1 Tax=Pedobacter puniceum TaxID=2666136 RepID=A0A7K0FSA7_9SPHI|nr:glycoside hydrolase family 13 protein [Pedobacter puniceum]MRX48170.1 alpha-amylase [Pedobacter puniceum]
MKKLLSIFLLLFCLQIFAAPKPLERVEPLFWWVGMKNQQLQLIIYGDKIAERTVQLNYPGVSLKKVHQVENPNYLFLDLEVSTSAKAGKFLIQFIKKGAKTLAYNYELRERDAKNRIQGITNKDFIYQLMPDRFANGDKNNDVVKGLKETALNRDSMYYRHGGDIQGIINHLDYIKELGATAIWLTPEVMNDQPLASYHGYAVTDHYQIDPRFGSNELYKKFVDEAHAKGLKVIKDVVHNHSGNEHWFIKDMPMKDWVHQWPTYTQTTYKDQTLMDIYAAAADKKQMLDGWFVRTMPDLNQENEFVQNYITQNIIWWVEYAGIDGLRLDTYPYNNLKYMAKWAAQMKAEFPHLGIFGETLVNSVVSQAYFTEGNTIGQGFDTGLPGVTDVQVKDAIYDVLNGKFDWTTGVNRLYSVLSQDFIYKDASRNVVFLDNHDMSRFFSIVGEDVKKFKSGLAMLLSTRGIPQLYYGTEIMMKNFSNPDGLVRSDFPGGWAEDKVNKFSSEGRTAAENDVFNYIKTIANYRKQTTALQTGKLMQFVPQDGVYVYFRYDNAKTVMVVVNSNDKVMSLETSRFSERTQGFKKAKDIVSGKVYDLSVAMEIPSISTLVMELQ